ncbi:MAG: hypothetical protein Q9162_007316 [Coniocarpon cinnabarinum]
MNSRAASRTLRSIRSPRVKRAQHQLPTLRPASLRPQAVCPRQSASNTLPLTRNLHTSQKCCIDILEPGSKAEPSKESDRTLQTPQATPLSDEEYHERSDKFFEELLEKLEEKQETSGDMDVEYAAGVMNVTLPSKGTYVLNKQPPNRQIWLSSPESGPKRFDWVISGESMDQKQGGEATGDWIYLRDGTSLTDLLQVEVGIQLDGAGREL